MFLISNFNVILAKGFEGKSILVGGFESKLISVEGFEGKCDFGGRIRHEF